MALVFNNSGSIFAQYILIGMIALIGFLVFLNWMRDKMSLYSSIDLHLANKVRHQFFLLITAPFMLVVTGMPAIWLYRDKLWLMLGLLIVCFLYVLDKVLSVVFIFATTILKIKKLHKFQQDL